MSLYFFPLKISLPSCGGGISSSEQKQLCTESVQCMVAPVSYSVVMFQVKRDTASMQSRSIYLDQDQLSRTYGHLNILLTPA